MRDLPDRLKRPITFVLVEPAESGNAGAVARAMANFGVPRLILVGAAAVPDATDRVAARAEGRPILEQAGRAPDLRSALASFHVAVGVTRRRGKHRPADLDPSSLREFLATLPAGAETAFVFGREADGLRADEVAQCGRLLSIPTSAHAPSLNLAQAAAITAFALFAAGVTGEANSPPDAGHPADSPASRPADHMASRAELEELFDSWEHSLARIGFLQGDRGPDTMISLRRIFGRAILSGREVRLLRSLARKIGGPGKR